MGCDTMLFPQYCPDGRRGTPRKPSGSPPAPPGTPLRFSGETPSAEIAPITHCQAFAISKA